MIGLFADEAYLFVRKVSKPCSTGRSQYVQRRVFTNNKRNIKGSKLNWQDKMQLFVPGVKLILVLLTNI